MAHDSDLWAKVTALFDQLVDAPADQRETALATAPADVAEMVQTLLDASSRSGMLDVQPAAEPPAARLPGGLAEGDSVGPFVVERMLGRGGMGEVYLARRGGGDFVQQVAIKLLRIDAGHNLASFAQERATLARMDHPGIARLIDGGLRGDGRPWMAMEFVAGEPIDRWCKAHDASLDQRLELFVQLGEAVQFAHRNLVVHRDIKPGNVLVDADGRVRLLDFGIAKLTGEVDPGAETTLALMTPQYAAPEQFERGLITVATDVHALGVLLYELLAGRGPWAGTGSLGAIVRRVVDEEPAAPSRAANRDAPVPAAVLRGDLDAIVLKAIRKDPQDRYSSVAAMLDDIAAYRAMQPVAARDGSRRYVLNRFLRRNRWKVAAAGALAATALAGTAAVAVQSHRVRIERDNAVAQASRLDAMIQTMTLMFAQDRAAPDGSPRTAEAMLGDAAQRLLASLDRGARSGASVIALSDLYINMQDVQGAVTLLRGSLAKGIGAQDPLSVARMKSRLANIVVNVGGPEDPARLLDEAEAVYAVAAGVTDQDHLDLDRTRISIARKAHDYDAVMRMVLSTMDRADRVYAGDRSELLTFYNNSLVYAMEAGRFDVADTIFVRIAPITARADMRDTMQALGIEGLRGVAALRRDRAREAVGILGDVTARRRQAFGTSAGLANDLYQLGRAQLVLGDKAAALAAFDEAEGLALQTMGPAAPPTLLMRMSRAEALALAGRTGEADAELAAIAAPMAALPKPSLPQAAFAQSRGVVLAAKGQAEPARAEFATAAGMYRALGAPGAYGLRSVERQLANLR